MRRLMILFFFVASGAHAQESDTLKKAFPPERPVVLDSIAAADQDTTARTRPDSTATPAAETKKETRKERKAKQREAKEYEKYYYKGVKKDSVRLEIERLSRVAWRRSLLVPGWGQYTNKGLWWIKVPVIYGGLVSGYVVFDFWNWYYGKFLDEIDYRMTYNGDKRDPDFMGFEGTEGLVRFKDYARRNRDLTIVVTTAFWGLNVVEAYVDSMLKNRWSINEYASVKLAPTFLPAFGMANTSMSSLAGLGITPGIKLTLALN